MSISVCLVTRNHGESLGRPLASVAGWAADLVVVDAGSSDNTVAVAQGLGARVVPHEWKDDFAAACNAALDAASGDWVLWMNPDEELDAAARQTLAVVVGDLRLFAATVRVQQLLRPDRRDYGTAESEPRFFRRDSMVRYRGRLHPQFVTPLSEIAAGRLQKMTQTNAVIRRHAYLSTPTPDKVRWVVRLLEAELRDRPGQLPLLIELGRNLLLLNDPRGHDVLAEAAGMVRKEIDAAKPSSPVVGSLVEYLLAVSPEQNRTGFSRDEARSLARRWFPRSPPVVWALAAERFAAGNFQGAVEPLELLLALGRSGQYDAGGGFDVDILGPGAALNLAICHFKLGNWEVAKGHAAAVFADPTRGQQAQRVYAAANAEAAKRGG